MKWKLIIILVGITIIITVGIILELEERQIISIFSQEKLLAPLRQVGVLNVSGITSSQTINIWLATKHTGQENEIMFSYIQDQNNPRTQLCLVVNQGVPPGQMPQSLNVYDSSDEFLFSIDRERIDIDDPLVNGEWGYCRSVDGELDWNYLKYGENSVVFEWSEIATVNYNDDWLDVNTTLLKLKLPNVTGVNDIFIFDLEQKFKFGARDNTTQDGEINSYKYIVQSSEPILEYGYGVYIIKQNSSLNCYQNPFEIPLCNDPKYEFTDIIEAFEFDYIGEEDNYSCSFDDYLNENIDCVVTFNTNVSMRFVDDLNTTLEVNFLAKHNDSLGFTNIDPVVVFSTNDVEGISMDVINKTAYLIIWCDETQDKTIFTSYYTNGTQIHGASLDNANGGCTIPTDYSVDVAVLDDVFAAAVWKGAGATPETVVFRHSVFNASLPFTNVFAVGRVNALSVSRLNSTRYVAAWIDVSSKHASVMLFGGTGLNLTGDFDTDTDVGKSSNTISITSFTNDDKNFSVVWFDSTSDNIQFVSLEINQTGDIVTTISPVVILTGQTTGNGAVTIDNFDEDRFVIGMADPRAAPLGGIKFGTWFLNGTNIQLLTTIEFDPGASKSVSVSTLNSTSFVYGWHDPTDAIIYFEVWTINGVQLVDNVTSEGAIANIPEEVLSTSQFEDICFDRFLVAGTTTGQGGKSQIKSYFPNGTTWNDGFCDFCVYENGNFEPPCDCSITENVNINDNNLTITGEGTFEVIGANITNVSITHINGVDSSNICVARLIDASITN